jgi:hypothetical protein
LAGGIAIAAGAAILDGNYESVVRLAASQMRAIAPEAPNAQLYLFLRMQSNKAYKPHVVMATVDAYLVRDGTILHSTRAMTEQVYIGGGGPSAAPAGFEQPQGEALRSLLVSDGVDHPYNFLVVLARWAIDDLHRQGVAGQSSNAPRA